MNPLSSDQVHSALTWRYATKKFDSTKQLSDSQWETLKSALTLSPSSFGLQPWRFINVKDSSLREKIKAAAWNQNQVTDASHLVVFAAKTSISASEIDSFVNLLATTRGVPEESLSGYKDMIKGFLIPQPQGTTVEDWATRQVYIALGMLLSTSANMGIDACPMEGFVPAQVNEILDLPSQGYSAKILCPFGFRAADDKYASMAKVRYPVDQIVVDV